MGSWQVLSLVCVVGCGRFGFAPAGTDGELAGEVIASRTCAELGGTVCAASETCLSADLPASDVGACCPRCFATGGRRLGDASEATTALVVDGASGDWTGVAALALDTHTIGTPSPADFSGTVAVQWDASRLYLLYTMTDDHCRPQDSVPPRTNAYNDDTAEVYLDMDPTNNTTAAYRPEEMWTWIVQSCGNGQTICGGPAPAAPLTTELATWIQPPPNNNPVPGPDLVATYLASGTTACTWLVEASVAWPTGFAPHAGDVIGFDAAANDDDTGMRKNQLFWNDATGTLYQDARHFGLLRLR